MHRKPRFLRGFLISNVDDCQHLVELTLALLANVYRHRTGQTRQSDGAPTTERANRAGQDSREDPSLDRVDAHTGKPAAFRLRRYDGRPRARHAWRGTRGSAEPACERSRSHFAAEATLIRPVRHAFSRAAWSLSVCLAYTMANLPIASSSAAELPQ